MADGPEKSLTTVTREGYTIWRGSFRGFMEPPHWDDLTEHERQGFMAVAAYATTQTVDDLVR